MAKKIGSAREVTLIEVLMVILIVGVVVVLIIPAMADREKIEKINEELIPTVKTILQKNEEFQEEYGDYAFDISQLNLQELANKKYFTYSLTDSTIDATTTKGFGREGVTVRYNFLNDLWTIEGPEGVIDKAWLP
jgi:type II secretory pathway pseudopilin PulG